MPRFSLVLKGDSSDVMPLCKKFKLVSQVMSFQQNAEVLIKIIALGIPFALEGGKIHINYFSAKLSPL